MNPVRWLLLAVVAAAVIATGVVLFRDDGMSGGAPVDVAAPTAAAKSAGAEPAVTTDVAPPAESSALREAVATEAAPSADAKPVAADATPARTVSGRVVDDAGRPVQDAAVEMISFGIALSEVKGAPAPSKTDASGKFSFAQRGDTSNTDRVRVRSKQHADAFAAVPAVPGAVDVGTIVVETGGSVMGRVLDTSGNAVAKAKVTAYVKQKDHNGGAPGLLVFGDLDPARTRSTMTDASGAWRIDGLPAGDVALSADADGFAPESKKGVQVEKLKVTPDIVLNLGKGSTIEGLVLDATGRPLAGAEVAVSRQVIDLTEVGVGATLDRDLVRTSDANGRFRIEGLRDEPYSLGVRADGYLRKSVERVAAGATDVRVQLRPSGVLFGVVTDTASKRPLDTFDVSAEGTGFGFRFYSRKERPTNVLRGAEAAAAAGVPEEPGLFAVTGLAAETVALNVSAEGYAAFERAEVGAPSGQKTRIDVTLMPEITVSGIVKAPDGTPVEGAIVTMASVDDGGDGDFPIPGGDRVRMRKRMLRLDPHGGKTGFATEGAPMSATTAADGTFTIDGLAAGEYTIGARHSVHAGSEKRPVSLEDGDQLEDLELKLRAGGTLVGTAFDQYGKPLPGAAVVLSAQDESQVSEGAFSRQEFGGFGDEAASATSDEAGHFTMAGVLPGEYLLRVNKPSAMGGSMMIAIAGVGDGPAGTPVEIREGETTTQDVSLPPTGDVVGSVTEAGRAVKGARVTVSSGGFPFGEPTAMTDELGNFAIRDVKPGAYTLVVDPPQAALPIKSKVRVDPKRESTEHVKLPSGAIRGSVVEQDTNKPLAGITIDVRKAKRGDDAGDGATRQVGVFAIAMRDGAGGGATTMKFGNENDSVVTDEHGNYEVKFLAAGEYTVEIRGGGIIKDEKENVAVPESGAAEGVDFRAAMGATLSVVADFGAEDENTDDDAGPFRFVQVSLSPADDPGEQEQQVHPAGESSTFPGLKPGRYTVEVTSGKKTGTQVVDIESGEQKKVTIPVR